MMSSVQLYFMILLKILGLLMKKLSRSLGPGLKILLRSAVMIKIYLNLKERKVKFKKLLK